MASAPNSDLGDLAGAGAPRASTPRSTTDSRAITALIAAARSVLMRSGGAIRTRSAARTPSSLPGRRSCASSIGNRLGDAPGVEGIRLAHAAVGAGIHPRGLHHSGSGVGGRTSQASPAGADALDDPQCVKVGSRAAGNPGDGTLKTSRRRRELSPVENLAGEAEEDRSWVASGLCIHAEDEWAGVRDDRHGGRRSLLVAGADGWVARQPAPVRVEVTWGHICDEPDPERQGGVGQSPDQVTEVGRTVPAALPAFGRGGPTRPPSRTITAHITALDVARMLHASQNPARPVVLHLVKAGSQGCAREELNLHALAGTGT